MHRQGTWAHFFDSLLIADILLFDFVFIDSAPDQLLSISSEFHIGLR